jgi:thiamine-phosphate diphosphorylase
MTLAGRHLRERMLYFITPSVGARVSPSQLPTIVESALRGGAEVVQWRQKPIEEELVAHPRVLSQWRDREHSPFLLPVARQIRELTRRYKVPLIINDSILTAEEIEADGLHIGQEDIPLTSAFLVRERREPWTVGVTVRNAEQAKAACQGGASYLGVGPVFVSSTKPGANDGATIGIEGLQECVEVANQYDIPVYAIGGLSLKEERIQRCIREGGASGVAVVAAISGAEDKEAAAAAITKELAPFRG